MIDFIKSDLERLIKDELHPTQFSIGGICLSNHHQKIPVDEINDLVLFDKVADEYLENGSDYTIKERIKMLSTHNAFIHLAGGLSCRITNEEITQIKIAKRYLEPALSFTKNDIELFHGKPEKEMVDDSMWGMDYRIESLISVYKNEMLYFYFEPGQLKLQEIRIGKVNEVYYTEK